MQASSAPWFCRQGVAEMLVEAAEVEVGLLVQTGVLRQSESPPFCEVNMFYTYAFRQ